LVVDLAGGFRNLVLGEPYSLETLQPVFSVTKGIPALAANMLVDRGQLQLDVPVSVYWPEFASAGKSEITVRWLLTHQSGLVGLDDPISQEQLLDWKYVVDRLADQRSAWKPGTKHGYHSLTYGFLVGEVIRRVTGFSVGQYVESQIAAPLSADLFIGLPDGMESRISLVLLPKLGPRQRILSDSGPYATRTFNWISPPLTPMDVNRPEIRKAQLPAANGIANARSLARMFASTIGKVDGVRCLSFDAMNRARREQWRGVDVVMGVENALGLGFLLPTEWCPFGGPGLFGIAGFGGSRAWVNPDLQIAFAYTPNLCSLAHFDAREAALSRAVVACANLARP
jgi:CubicO group peptidase (beta-lactamase class C family)